MSKQASFRIGLDRQWTLDDLYRFPRAFQQVYFFWNALEVKEDDAEFDRIMHTFSSLPWQGGYSAVNFFEHLKYVVPRRDRPAITSIHYSSPGALELALIVPAALALSRVVKSIAFTIDHCNTIYANIYKGMQDRKLLRIKTELEVAKLEKEKSDFVEASVRQMGRVLRIAPNAINNRTGHPYVSLKILMAVYRRVRLLADYERRGKAAFPADASEQPLPKSSTRKIIRKSRRRPKSASR
jgi:hypothetical protein